MALERQSRKDPKREQGGEAKITRTQTEARAASDLPRRDRGPFLIILASCVLGFLVIAWIIWALVTP